MNPAAGRTGGTPGQGRGRATTAAGTTGRRASTEVPGTGRGGDGTATGRRRPTAPSAARTTAPAAARSTAPASGSTRTVPGSRRTAAGSASGTTSSATGTAPGTRAPAATAPTPAAVAPARSPRRTTGTVAAPGRGAPRTPAGGVVAQGSAARFAERARAHRRLTQRRILIVVAAVLAVAGLAWLLFFSPVLALRADQVQVTGADSVVAMDQVQAVVDARDGLPLPRLDTSALRSELLEVPGVRDVTVTREWPHGLSVALVAREPVAAVPEDSEVVRSAEGTPTGSGFALVDEEGVQVGRADAAPEGLPVVEVPVGEERVLSAVLGVLEQLPEDLLAQVGEVSATTQDSVNFTLRDGAAVEWGSDQDSPLKAAVLSALRAAPETAGASRYDVSAPTMPVVG
ncbi:FtsQ-type POTRA domain-containing protein [Cellulomonas denverensis]|uniref:FtsQ-type POTRA domain-containing protein n=1 Tax=Cellulomonas denverensis TaxID=264297 RepID=A0A7X6KXE5_9CELL|nr:FtsQ-type POTRA domain-containing protein [Cellulomonas denverensis]